MGCQQSIPSSTTTTTDSNKTTPTTPAPAPAPAPPTSTTTTTTTTTGTGTTQTLTNGAHTAVTATTTATTIASTTTSATPTTTTNTLAESATNTTTTTTTNTSTTMAPQQQQQQQQQRQPARNIFAKPLLLTQNVVTTATNTATTTAQTAHQHVQNITQAIGTMMTNVIVTTTEGTHNTNTTTKSSVLPHYEKSIEINQFLMDTLQTNFIFEHCTHTELQQLCSSMEPYPVHIGTTIIQQGEPIGDYFYIIYSGTVTFIVDGMMVGTASKGQHFGELSLLYSAPRAATVMATTSAENSDSDDTTNNNNNTKHINNNDDPNNNMIVLYRLDQITFRTILQQQTLNVSNEYMNLLRKVKFLTELDDYNLYKLSSVLQKHTFTKDTIIVQKGDINAHVCYILVEGMVTCSEISINDGSCTYSDIVLDQPGDYFGERAIITGEPRAATVTATSNIVTCYTIDKITFDTVLGNYQSIISKANEERLLSTIPLICSSKLPSPVLKSMTQLVKETTYPIGTTICHKNEVCEPALYIIRTGYVTIHKSDTGSDDTTITTTTTIGPGGYFGDDQLLFDITKKEHKLPPGAAYRPSYTVVAGNQNNHEETLVTVGILTLAALRTIMDTQYIGQPIPVTEHKDSLLFDRNIVLSKLQRHTILGAGTFGMVYLVSRTNAIGERVAYALKVQSKYELIKEGQAMAVISEKNIMAKLQHPFLIGLINTYHDDTFVYILLQLIQGGELYSYIHTKTHDYLPEESARFYAACIGEGLGYMHKQGYVYRDLKPENVLVDHTGYCVIIDFGFAKYVPIPTKTFTLCGTPLYIAPEVILNRGHNSGADHWSYGILIYEMLFGSNPFYKHGMDQMDLFRGIVKARYVKPMHIPASDEGHAIIKELLSRDPNQRLGNLAAGEDGILYHPWFSSYNIDMDDLRIKKYTAPVIPKIKDPLDSSNFENWDHLDDKTKKKYPPVSTDDQSMFDNF